MTKYHAVTSEEQCQIFVPVDPRKVGQGRGKMRAIVGEAKTILGLKIKELYGFEPQRCTIKMVPLGAPWPRKVTFLRFHPTRCDRAIEKNESLHHKHRLSLPHN